MEFAPDRAEFYLGTPTAAYRRLRAEDPLHWYQAGSFWCALKHADVMEISRAPRVFSSAYGSQLFEIPLRLAGGGIDLDSAPSIIRMDPPEHNRHRKLAIGTFTPRRVAMLEPRIRALARESLESVVPGEAVDFVESVAVPLPMYMIAELLGVPSSDFAMFRRWSDAMIEAGGGGPTRETVAIIAEFAAYIGEKAAERRLSPRRDVLSQLATAEVDGDRLSDPEIVIFALTLLVAGNETTRNLISGGMKALIERPDQLARLRERRELVPNAVEEMLRYVHPVQNFVRRVESDTELRGRKLRSGQYIVLFYGSANRDEEVFGDDAEAFDIEREQARRHLSFGFGEHLCLGASLARLEARVMFEELLDRFTGAEFAGPVKKLSSVLINGVERMPVVFRD